MGNANVLGVDPIHVEVSLLRFDLVLQTFHFTRCFHKCNARISTTKNLFILCLTTCFVFCFYLYFEVDYPLGPSMPIPAESYPRYSNRFSPCIKIATVPLHSDIKHCCALLQSYLYLDEQLDDLCPGLRGQVIEVGKDSAHDETSYLEAKKESKTGFILQR